MKTLAELKARCAVREGHWLWLGGMSSGHPRLYAPDYTRDPSGQTMTAQMGPRAVWHIRMRAPIPAGHRVFRTCGHAECLSWQCLACQSMRERGEVLAQEGLLKGRLRRIVANRAIGRARSQLTPEKIEVILTSPKTGLQLQAELGVCRTTISRLRTGQGGKSFEPVGSVFGALARG